MFPADRIKTLEDKIKTLEDDSGVDTPSVPIKGELGDK